MLLVPSVALDNVGVSHMDNDVFDEGPTLHIRTWETTAYHLALELN